MHTGGISVEALSLSLSQIGMSVCGDRTGGWPARYCRPPPCIPHKTFAYQIGAARTMHRCLGTRRATLWLTLPPCLCVVPCRAFDGPFPKERAVLNCGSSHASEWAVGWYGWTAEAFCGHRTIVPRVLKPVVRMGRLFTQVPQRSGQQEPTAPDLDFVRLLRPVP